MHCYGVGGDAAYTGGGLEAGLMKSSAFVQVMTSYIQMYKTKTSSASKIWT